MEANQQYPQQQQEQPVQLQQGRVGPKARTAAQQWRELTYIQQRDAIEPVVGDIEAATD